MRLFWLFPVVTDGSPFCIDLRFLAASLTEHRFPVLTNISPLWQSRGFKKKGALSLWITCRSTEMRVYPQKPSPRTALSKNGPWHNDNFMWCKTILQYFAPEWKWIAWQEIGKLWCFLQTQIWIRTLHVYWNAILPLSPDMISHS